MPTFDDVGKSLRIALGLPAGGKQKAVLNLAKYHAMAVEEKNTLSGTKTHGEEAFKDFKDKVIAYQRQEIGLIWKRLPGQNGPISFDRFSIPGEFGTLLAQQQLAGAIQNGDFSALIFAKLELNPSEIDKLKGDFLPAESWSKARERFTCHTDPTTHEHFVFSQGPGFKFQRVKRELKFNGKEKELQHQLEETNTLRQQLELDKIIQITGLAGAKYHNVDLAGYKLIHRRDGDVLEVAALEVKKDNSISSVMTAIAQATAYKVMAQRCYIAAPGLNEADFHDPPRFQEIRRICEDGGIGIVSIQLEGDKTINSVSLVLEPKVQTPLDPGFQDVCTKAFGLEFCLVCRRWIRNKSECGWKGGPAGCMKEAIEKMVNQTPH